MYFHRKSNQHLPPTSNSTRNYILRSLFETYKMVLILTLDSPDLDPTSFGYVINDGLLVADRAKQPIHEVLQMFFPDVQLSGVFVRAWESCVVNFVLVQVTVTFVKVTNFYDICWNDSDIVE